MIDVRTPSNSQAGIDKGTLMASSSDDGIVNTHSNHSVDRTVEHLKDILRAKGIALFALITKASERFSMRVAASAYGSR
jgi:hypothetical protein